MVEILNPQDGLILKPEEDEGPTPRKYSLEWVKGWADDLNKAH